MTMANRRILAAPWRGFRTLQDHADQGNYRNHHLWVDRNTRLTIPYLTVLHDQLLAAQLQAGHAAAPPPPRPQPGMAHVQPMRDHSNIDPAISGAAATTGMIPAPPPPQPQQPQQQQQQPQQVPQVGQTPDQAMQDAQQAEPRKTYGKRELSTSKRAAQNRAAQVPSPARDDLMRSY